jgi:hypothetical protein
MFKTSQVTGAEKIIELILHIHGGFYLALTKGSFTREIKNVVCRSLLRFYFVGGRIHNNLFFEAFKKLECLFLAGLSSID